MKKGAEASSATPGRRGVPSEVDSAIIKILLSSKKRRCKFSYICDTNPDFWGYRGTAFRRQAQNRRQYLMKLQAFKRPDFLQVCDAQAIIVGRNQKSSVVDQIEQGDYPQDKPQDDPQDDPESDHEDSDTTKNESLF
jgi:hypothetical protein